MILDWLQEGRGCKNRKDRVMNRSLWIYWSLGPVSKTKINRVREKERDSKTGTWKPTGFGRNWSPLSGINSSDHCCNLPQSTWDFCYLDSFSNIQQSSNTLPDTNLRTFHLKVPGYPVGRRHCVNGNTDNLGQFLEWYLHVHNTLHRLIRFQSCYIRSCRFRCSLFFPLQADDLQGNIFYATVKPNMHVLWYAAFLRWFYAVLALASYPSTRPKSSAARKRVPAIPL